MRLLLGLTNFTRSLGGIERQIDAYHVDGENPWDRQQLADQRLGFFGALRVGHDGELIARRNTRFNARVACQSRKHRRARGRVPGESHHKTTDRHRSLEVRANASGWLLQFVVALALSASACQRDVLETFAPPPGKASNPVTIHDPRKLSSIETGEHDPSGRPIRVACATCHSLREAGPLPQSPSDLKDFHVGLQFTHGTLECASCHQPGEYDNLHLADGRRIPMREAMTLCAQCHGSQYRDYSRGAHGGMSGYWDLSRGPRLRNHCVDCHDPHVPRYGGMQPVLKPHDRIPPSTQVNLAGDAQP